MKKDKRKKRFRLIFMFTIIISIVITSVPLSVISNNNYQPTYEPQAFTIYSTLTFNGSANITAQSTFTSYTLLTFNGSADVQEGTKITDISPSTWTGGSKTLNNWIMENFTYYQNGTATIDINISFNDTNYTFVSYATWAASGHNQWCANFTTDLWATETNIAPGYPPTTELNSSVPGDTSFPFGIRIWMPKTMDYERQEDFVLVTTNTTS